MLLQNQEFMRKVVETANQTIKEHFEKFFDKPYYYASVFDALNGCELTPRVKITRGQLFSGFQHVAHCDKAGYASGTAIFVDATTTEVLEVMELNNSAYVPEKSIITLNFDGFTKLKVSG